ncbi:MAG: hypothetical protein R3C42_02220 [Parvularculaceae bacterium]|nr:hypothetical protein [Parvularculaceae bacterium]
MTIARTGPGHICARYLTRARWLARDTLSRRPAGAAAEFLDAHAAELSLSPYCGEQILGAALGEAARAIAAGARPLARPPAVFVDFDAPLIAERRAIRRRAFDSAPDHWRSARDEARAFCRRSNFRADPLARDLIMSRGSLRLQECLWDHPRISAPPAARLSMFFLLLSLDENANALRASAGRLRKQSGRASIRRLLDAARQIIPADAATLAEISQLRRARSKSVRRDASAPPEDGARARTTA